MTNHTHEIPGSPADNPLPRSSECDDDVLLPLMGPLVVGMVGLIG